MERERGGGGEGEAEMERERGGGEGGCWCNLYARLLVCRPSVCLLPDVRGRGAASPLTSHVTKGGRGRGCTAVACHVNKVRRINIARTARQRRSWLGEWAATKLRLSMTTAPGPGAGVTGKQQRRYSGWAATALCVCKARQTGPWMSRQIQANSRGDRDGAATTSAKRTKVSGICRRAETEPRSKV